MRLPPVLLSLFALLLLLAQQQAVVHAYVHVTDWLQKSDDGALTCYPDACEKCALLADLHSAVMPAAMALQTQVETFESPLKPVLSVFAVGLPPYQSHAPPFLA